MKKLLVILCLIALSANAQRVINTSTTGGVLSQPTGVPAANSLQTYTGTKTNNALARFDGSGNIKSSAVTVADDGTVSVSGSGTGRIALWDADASNSAVIRANDTTTVNGNYQLPAAPASGIWYSILSAVTNAPLSILAHPGSAGLVLISTNSNAYTWGAISGGGGGTGATNVLVNGANIVQANFTSNYNVLPTVSGANITLPKPLPYTLTDGATIALNAALSSDYVVTLGGNRTLSNPSNPTDGQEIVVEVIQDATGTRTLAADTQYAGGGDFTIPSGFFSISTNASSSSYLKFKYKSTATKWRLVGQAIGY